ncbi:MAG: HAMP domain-containing sensor histidine kinase [Hespellia sp.]|nr:HAMP domain-containing sensor histidine kinase [Hespellia sp.]
MNTANRFFRKYLFSSILILCAFFIINIGLIIGVLAISWNNSTDPDIPLSQIVDCIHTNEQGTVSADKRASELLNEKSSWAMVLNTKGEVTWEEAMPDNLPRQYSAVEIAKFSRWYLDEYPVLVQEIPSGLLVIGCPSDSLVKCNFVTDADYIRTAIKGIIVVVICNITLMLLLFWYNTRKVEKAVTPILNGIAMIAHGNTVALSENGELAEINAEVNRAGKYILKKDQARAEWIAGISHDVRTPLTIMLGYAGEIEDDEVLPSRTRTQAKLIRQKGEKLRHLIADLNLTSKLEYSMQPLHLETVYPVELVRQVITEYLNNEVDEKYLFELQVAENANTLSFQGDVALLIRLLDNLIGNAIHHNPDGCTISIIVCKQESTCLIGVEDNGIGMREEQIISLNDCIFANPYNHKNEMPHGLGLRLSTQIVQAHNGKIIFTNRPSKGLSVHITIPLT